MEKIVAELLANTAALGVWVLAPEVLAGAVTDPSIEPPRNALVESETYLDLADRRIFATPVGTATLVVVFDDRSSLGLIRLRVRHAKEAIERALAS